MTLRKLKMKNIVKLFKISDQKVLDKLNFEYETKMWNLTKDPKHSNYGHYFEMKGAFEEASGDDIEQTSTCCHTTGGMLK